MAAARGASPRVRDGDTSSTATTQTPLCCGVSARRRRPTLGTPQSPLLHGGRRVLLWPFRPGVLGGVGCAPRERPAPPVGLRPRSAACLCHTRPGCSPPRLVPLRPLPLPAPHALRHGFPWDRLRLGPSASLLCEILLAPLPTAPRPSHSPTSGESRDSSGSRGR